MLPPLSELLQEPVEAVKVRERNTLEQLLSLHQDRVVLFGAGTLGMRAAVLLREIGVSPLAFSDNNEARWNSEIDGIPVLSPSDAASRFGSNSAFFVTIWNVHHWFAETLGQLTALGCSSVYSYAPIFWRFPETFMQLTLLNEPPHRLYQNADQVLKAERVWDDEESRSAYRGNIYWRAIGDGSQMPTRLDEDTYFPRDLLQLAGEDILLDCGAFDGDTIDQMLQHSRAQFQAVYAIEADAISFQRLCDFIQSKPQLSAKMHPIRAAVGRSRCTLFFESSGSVTSKTSAQGEPVECFPIDELFADKPLTMIKMDIEGAEYEALLGGKDVIRRDQPLLAICVYHTQSDVWRIPLLIREFLPEHRLFLRCYEGDRFQSVLFAVPPERLTGHRAEVARAHLDDISAN